MTKTSEMILIGGIAKALRDRGSWTGETHIQKASYIAKVVREVPFESDFVLYKHGPFSFDLSKSISHMVGRSFLYLEVNPGYGPSYRLSEQLWKALDNSLQQYYKTYESSILSICTILAKKNVAELERIATAVYVSSNHPLFDSEENASMIMRLKPHITRELALEAVCEARTLAQ
jgi:uncharacterized protein YwgA